MAWLALRPDRQPETLVAWHRTGWKSRHRQGRPSISREVIDPIRKMSLGNPLSGVPRIHGELLNLGFELTESTVAKYRVRLGNRPHKRDARSSRITRALPSPGAWRGVCLQGAAPDQIEIQRSAWASDTRLTTLRREQMPSNMRRRSYRTGYLLAVEVSFPLRNFLIYQAFTI